MPNTLSEQANKAALDSVKAEKPNQFTVGGYITREGEIVGGITYDRKLSNLWGLTAYAKAYWHDLPVMVNAQTKPQIEGEAGFELARKF